MLIVLGVWKYKTMSLPNIYILPTIGLERILKKFVFNTSSYTWFIISTPQYTKDQQKTRKNVKDIVCRQSLEDVLYSNPVEYKHQ